MSAYRAFEIGTRYRIRIDVDSITVSRCRFALARELEEDGSEIRYAGSSAEMRAGLDRLPDDFREEILVSALRTAASRYSGRVSLDYNFFDLRRLLSNPECGISCKTAKYWALCGQIWAGNGNSVPIGWSGYGDGLERIRDRRLHDRISWIMASLESAVPTAEGRFPTILSPQAAAVLLHESVGHFVEGGDPTTPLNHRLGIRVAAERIDVVDDPCWAGGAVHYEVDDEGTDVLAPTTVVRNGVLVAQLHSHSSAAAASTLSTANGRAAIWAAPLPRMSNLVCSVGDCSEDALIDQIQNGMMVHQLADGFGLGAMVEAKVVLAETIKNGRRTGRFTHGGRVRDKVGLMTRAVALSNRAEVNPNGMCGKRGQILFDVGTIAPAIQLSELSLEA